MSESFKKHQQQRARRVALAIAFWVSSGIVVGLAGWYSLIPGSVTVAIGVAWVFAGQIILSAFESTPDPPRVAELTPAELEDIARQGARFALYLRNFGPENRPGWSVPASAPVDPDSLLLRRPPIPIPLKINYLEWRI